MSKALVELILPAAESSFDVYIPLESKIGDVLNLLCGIFNDLAEGKYKASGNDVLCDATTGIIFDVNKVVAELGIKNGSKLMLI